MSKANREDTLPMLVGSGMSILKILENQSKRVLYEELCQVNM